MLDFRARGLEHVCIVCVEAEREAIPIASAELAGCAAVVREILRELQHAAAEESCSREQVAALINTASDIILWMTPPTLREPSTVGIDKSAVIHLLSSYEVKWGRATGIRSFASTYQMFAQIQSRALQYAELAAIDRRYSALTGQESVVREITY